MGSGEDFISSFCNICQRDNKHKIVYCLDRDRKEGDSQLPSIINEKWQLLQCGGCDSIKVYFVEDCTDFKEVREKHYPPRHFRSLPQWSFQLPGQFQELIQEIYTAFYAECLSLAAMGTRTLIDLMLLEMLGDVGGFEAKLEEAVRQGLLTKEKIDTISSAVEAGHAASHRGYRPTKEQFDDVLEIVEHALKERYVLQGASRRLNGIVPKRGKR